MSNKWIPNIAKAKTKSPIFRNFESISDKNKFFSKKELIEKKKYDYKEEDFPDLNKLNKDVIINEKNDIYGKNNWCNVINRNKPIQVEKKKKKIVKIKKNIEWCEEDEVNEKFDLFYTNTMLDIHYAIKEYCQEKFLPFYNKYDSYHNLVEFVKDNSSIYNSLYSDKESESDENDLDIELNENI